MLLPRPSLVASVIEFLEQFPVVGLVGARQVGKTTLARLVAEQHPGPVTHFDLEDPDDLARLTEPSLALRPLRGLVVLDEIQHAPQLFPLLRVLADRPDTPARFLVLGSASPSLLRQGAESLAGRIAWVEVDGFSLAEVGVEALSARWTRGGLPRSFLAPSDSASTTWRRQYVRNLVERDLPQLGIDLPAVTMRRFWTMLAHWHGQLWNASELGRAFGVADTTVKRYLDALTGAFLVRQFKPWHANISKRQVKSPRIYIADTGLLHHLLGLDDAEALLSHPVVGASWEGLAMDAIIDHLGADREQCWFWRTHGGAELDLFILHQGRRLGFELKRTTTPKLTRSMHHALADLELDELVVVHAGEHAFPLSAEVRAIPLSRLSASLTAPPRDA